MHGGGFTALVERKQKQGVIAPRSKRKASPEAVDPGDQADFYPIWIDVCCLFLLLALAVIERTDGRDYGGWCVGNDFDFHGSAECQGL